MQPPVGTTGECQSFPLTSGKVDVAHSAVRKPVRCVLQHLQVISICLSTILLAMSLFLYICRYGALVSCSLSLGCSWQLCVSAKWYTVALDTKPCSGRCLRDLRVALIRHLAMSDGVP